MSGNEHVRYYVYDIIITCEILCIYDIIICIAMYDIRMNITNVYFDTIKLTH